ncbi:hypothetical protein K7432_011183 [Basidiobolus ranarum]|uniref:BCAS3 WD40 domain-containing protein n=1 Tax=Basidiobolus ranarum TaxID=34480 RepID=A0ABR2WML9_9FUNG
MPAAFAGKAKVSSFQFPKLATIPKDVAETRTDSESPFGLPLYGSSLQSGTLLSPLTSPTVEFAKISPSPIPSGVRAEPNILTASTTEKVSVLIQGISTYVSNSLPETLAKVKNIALASKPNKESPEPVYDTVEQDTTVKSESNNVTCASFDYIEGVYRTPQDLISDTEKTFTHSQRKFCLLLGYHDGFQIWNLSDLSNVTEIFSYRDSKYDVFCVKNVPTPRISESVDQFKHLRCIMAIGARRIGEDRKIQGSTLSFFSLQTHESIKDLHYHGKDFFGLECNERGIIVYYDSTIEIISSYTLDVVFKFDDAHPSLHNRLPILSVGDRLLAYASVSEMPKVYHEKVTSDSKEFDMTKVAREALSGMRSMSDLGYRKLANYLSNYQHNPNVTSLEPSSQRAQSYPNQVTVIDLDKLGYASAKNPRKPEARQSCEIGHFEVEKNLDIITFNPSGSLIAVASIEGYSAYIYEISANGENGCLGSITLRYELYRGYTSARIDSINFSQDSRWVSINTIHGTSHVYAINSYCGNRKATSYFDTYAFYRSSSLNQKITEKSVKSLSPLLRIRNRETSDTKDTNSDTAFSFSQIHRNSSNRKQQMPMLNYFQLASSQIANIPSMRNPPSSQVQDILSFSMSGMLKLCRMSITKTEQTVTKDGRNYNDHKLLGSSSDLVEWSLLRDSDWSEVLGVIEGVESKDTDPRWPSSSWVNEVETLSYPVPSVSLWSSRQFHFQTYMSPDKLENWDEALHLPLTKDINAINRCTVPYGVGYLPRCDTEHNDLNLASLLEENMLDAMETNVTPTLSKSISNGSKTVQEYRAELHKGTLVNFGAFFGNEIMTTTEIDSTLGTAIQTSLSSIRDSQDPLRVQEDSLDPAYDSETLEWPESDDELNEEHFQIVAPSHEPDSFSNISKSRENHSDSSTDDDEIFMESCSYPSLPPRRTSYPSRDSRSSTNGDCQISHFPRVTIDCPYPESDWTPQPRLQEQDTYSWTRPSHE